MFLINANASNDHDDGICSEGFFRRRKLSFSILLAVNPQKLVRLSFPTLVFLVRLSFESFSMLQKLGKSLIHQIKALNQRSSKMA